MAQAPKLGAGAAGLSHRAAEVQFWPWSGETPLVMCKRENLALRKTKKRNILGGSKKLGRAEALQWCCSHLQLSWTAFRTNSCVVWRECLFPSLQVGATSSEHPSLTRGLQVKQRLPLSGNNVTGAQGHGVGLARAGNCSQHRSGSPGPTCLHEHLPYVPDLSSPPATASGPA